MDTRRTFVPVLLSALVSVCGGGCSASSDTTLPAAADANLDSFASVDGSTSDGNEALEEASVDPLARRRRLGLPRGGNHFQEFIEPRIGSSRLQVSPVSVGGNHDQIQARHHHAAVPAMP